MELKALLQSGMVWTADPTPFTALPSFPPACEALPFGIAELDQALPGGGLRYGGIHEFFPEGQSACSLPCLLATQAYKVRPTSSLLWIGKECWPTPFTIKEITTPINIDALPACLFIDPPSIKEKLWAIELALKSPAVGIVVAQCEKLSFVTSRRLALSAKAQNTLGLIIRNKKDLRTPSAALTRWSIAPLPSTTPTWKLELLSSKGAKSALSAWIISVEDGKWSGTVPQSLPQKIALRA